MNDQLEFMVYFVALLILFITFNFLEKIARDFKIQRGLKITGNLFFAVSIIVFSIVMGIKTRYIFIVIALVLLVIYLSFNRKK
jgi:hypothetical protein